MVFRLTVACLEIDTCIPWLLAINPPVPPDLPPERGLTVTDFQYDNYYPNEQLSKKPEVSIFENMAKILEKSFFRGWYPLKKPLQGV